jgi:hypothetical protein
VSTITLTASTVIVLALVRLPANVHAWQAT